MDGVLDVTLLLREVLRRDNPPRLQLVILAVGHVYDAGRQAEEETIGGVPFASLVESAPHVDARPPDEVEFLVTRQAPTITLGSRAKLKVLLTRNDAARVRREDSPCRQAWANDALALARYVLHPQSLVVQTLGANRCRRWLRFRRGQLPLTRNGAQSHFLFLLYTTRAATRCGGLASHTRLIQDASCCKGRGSHV